MNHDDDSARTDLLGLTGVLAHALPAELGTPSAPARYTVSAVFTRRPLPREVTILEGPDARAELARAGYSTVGLKVVDRRLEIGDTSLEELESGLAAVIGTMLRTVSAAVAAMESERLSDLRVAGERELHRSEEIVERASRITFDPTSMPAPRLETAAL